LVGAPGLSPPFGPSWIFFTCRPITGRPCPATAAAAGC
jgi:hypothetical protein